MPAAAFASRTLPLVDVLSLMKGRSFFAERLVAENFIYGTSFCPNPALFDASDNGARRRTFIFDVS
jgi:hypothetical protein